MTFEELSGFASIAGFALSALALPLAIYAVNQAWKQARESQRLLKNYSRIASEQRMQTVGLDLLNSRSQTAFVGAFPSFMGELVSLIANTQSKLDCMCVVPIHGIMSSPFWWAKYENALRDKQSDSTVDIEFVINDYATQKGHLYAEFPTISVDFPAWIGAPENYNRVSDLIENHYLHDANVETDKLKASEDLWMVLEDLIKQARTKWFPKVRHTESNRPISIYFWIADEKTAIVAFPVLSSSVLDYAFKTSDKGLIDALLEMKRSYTKTPFIPPV